MIIGYPMLKPHDLRHGVAMEILEQHRDLEAVPAMLGHTRIDPEAVFFWEVFGCLKWSVMCMMKGQSHLRGSPRSLEQLAIGRRSEEPLHDLLALLRARR